MLYTIHKFTFAIKDNLIAKDDGIPGIEHILDEFICIKLPARSICRTSKFNILPKISYFLNTNRENKQENLKIVIIISKNSCKMMIQCIVNCALNPSFKLQNSD